MGIYSTTQQPAHLFLGFLLPIILLQVRLHDLISRDEALGTHAAIHSCAVFHLLLWPGIFQAPHTTSWIYEQRQVTYMLY